MSTALKFDGITIADADWYTVSDRTAADTSRKEIDWGHASGRDQMLMGNQNSEETSGKISFAEDGNYRNRIRGENRDAVEEIIQAVNAKKILGTVGDLIIDDGTFPNMVLTRFNNSKTHVIELPGGTKEWHAIFVATFSQWT